MSAREGKKRTNAFGLDNLSLIVRTPLSPLARRTEGGEGECVAEVHYYYSDGVCVSMKKH